MLDKKEFILAHSYTVQILNSIRLTQYTRHAATAPTQRNDVNHWMFLNYNFSKEQCMLPEDDRVIETCRGVLSVFIYILD